MNLRAAELTRNLSVNDDIFILEKFMGWPPALI